MSSYEVTATRKRPQTFSELVGQDFVVSTLKNSIQSGRIAHAYLFAGPRGVGKTSAARILAAVLNCPEGPNADGCAEQRAAGDMDVIEIDGASNTSVNDVRAIKDEVLFAPVSSQYKIYIIDEVHMLSNNAFNALLKTIEEPPPYIIFIFATTEIHKVPATIRSRCQQFNFRLLMQEDIKQMLQEVVDELGINAESGALSWIAREAAGSLRDAYTVFDQVLAFSEGHITLEAINKKLGLTGVEKFNVLFQQLLAQNVMQSLEITNEILQGGVSVERFTIELADYLRVLLLIVCGITRESLLGIPAEQIPEQIRSGFSRFQVESANEMVLSLYRNIRYSANSRFDLELVISRLASLQTLLSPKELVSRVQELQEQVLNAGMSQNTQDPQTDVSKEEKTDSAVSASELASDHNSGNEYTGVQMEGITQKQIHSIVEHVQQKSISVAEILRKVSVWRVFDGNLHISVPDSYGLDLIQSHTDMIKEAVTLILQTNIIRIQGEVLKKGKEPISQEVQSAIRLFQGEIVEKQE